MLGIRQKLSLGFGGLLILIVAIGTQSLAQFTTLGHSIDVILRENYRSVIASEQMKEALERMDSGALFSLLGDTVLGRDLIGRNIPAFEAALQIASSNITLPGEEEKTRLAGELFKQYKSALDEIQQSETSVGNRREAYFSRLFPLFHQIKDTADEILQMNHQSMMDANERARAAVASAKRRMYLLLLSGAAVALLFIVFTGKWILQPINRLIRSTDEIRRGNLELVVQSDSTDEIGRLSEAFNAMASSLRNFRRSDHIRIARIQRSTRQVFKSLPDAIVVADPDGCVEVATEPAGEVFGLRPGTRIHGVGLEWLGVLFDEALRSARIVEGKGRQAFIQRFVRGEEHFFRPEAAPILDGERQVTGVILILKDVTQQIHQDELKRGVISTVSHQLKTPLTSLRMAVYLLLEEKAGPLSPKQTELLLAARDDSDRLHSILAGLLDISRIESGKMRMDLRPESPRTIIFDQVERFRNLAKDRGIVLRLEVPDALPDVLADPVQIEHVLANLLSNALKYTSPGGEIRISAELREGAVCFAVSDTGKGIPQEYQDRVFEPFFRAPGQDGESGEGLGLAIAKEIIEAHGGSIEVQSEEGIGSVLTFCLNTVSRGRPEGGSEAAAESGTDQEMPQSGEV